MTPKESNWLKRRNRILVDGAKMSQARINANYSIEEVAKSIGCGQSQVSRWEREILVPTEERIAMLVKLYGRNDFVKVNPNWEGAKELAQQVLNELSEGK